MGKKTRPNSRTGPDYQGWMTDVEVGLREGWVYNACVLYAYLLEARNQGEGQEIGRFLATHEPTISEILKKNREALAKSLSENSRSLSQMLRGGYGLIYEQLETFLSELTSTVLLENLFTILQVPTPGFEKLPSDAEILAFLTDKELAHEFPLSWPRLLVAPLNLDRHWWWRLPPQIGGSS
jgi:hypothetical protein